MKKQFSFQRIIAVVATVMLMGSVLTACKKTDGVSTRIPSAGLMVFNLAPDKIENPVEPKPPVQSNVGTPPTPPSVPTEAADLQATDDTNPFRGCAEGQAVSAVEVRAEEVLWM